MKPLRILHLSTLYPPHIVGGAEKSVGLLAETQARAGHAVAAACLSPEGWARGTQNGVDVYRMPHENNFWMEEWPRHSQRAREWAKFKQQANFAIERHFESVIRDHRPDIINTHSLVDVSTRVWHAARRSGVPVVHTLRDFDLLCAASSMFREDGPCHRPHAKCRILTFAKRFDQRQVAAVTAVGSDVLERHLSLGFFGHVPPAQRRVIWNAVELKAGGIEDRSARSDPTLTIGYLGRLSPEKGVDVLLRAVRRLPPSGWRLRIAGAAPDGHADLQAAAAGLPIDFLGFTEPTAFLNGIDVLVVPSLWAEPLGRTVIEAYLQGVPVIGSATGGIAELVADPEWLFAPGDDLALSERILRLLRDGRQALPPPSRFDRVVSATRPAQVAAAFDEVYARTLSATERRASAQ